MTVVAEISTESEQYDLDEVFTDFNDGDLVLTHEPDSSYTQIRTAEEDTLSQFHESCVKHGLTLSIRRIYHEPGDAQADNQRSR